jgi:hypothetical protein
MFKLETITGESICHFVAVTDPKNKVISMKHTHFVAKILNKETEQKYDMTSVKFPAVEKKYNTCLCVRRTIILYC